MPRYSSVQTYADSNSRAISYEQAAGSVNVGVALHTDKVVNPYGSVAGANSGDFHVYRHARARELERVQVLEETREEREKDLEFQRKLQEYEQEAEERTAKRRKKRQRAKQAKERKKNLQAAGINVTGILSKESPSVNDQEFVYVPASAATDCLETDATPKDVTQHEAVASVQPVEGNAHDKKDDDDDDDDDHDDDQHEEGPMPKQSKISR